MLQIKRPDLNSFPILALLLGLMLLMHWGLYHLTGTTVPENAQARIIETGGRDLPIYWCAWQVHTKNENLYSLEQTEKYRSDKIGHKDVIHNPPWSLWLFAPVTWLPYKYAHMAWIILNFILIPLNVLLSLRLYRISTPRPLIFLFMCLFTPAFLCWHYGQVTLLLTTITLLMLYSHRLRYDWLVGACLSFMTIKPHIYYLLAFLIGLDAIFHVRWRIFIGFALTFVVLLLPFKIQGTAITDWLTWVSNGQASVYMTTTISTWIRIFIAPDNGIPPVWPMYLIPSLSLLAGSCWYLLRRRSNWAWEELSIPLIAISLFTAPYSWAYDFCLLIGWHVLLVNSWNKNKRIWLLIACFFSLMFIAQTSLTLGDMHLLIWFPVMAICSWWFFHCSRRQS